MRCLALAQAWRRKGQPATFACSRLTEFARRQIESAGFHAHHISADPGTVEDARELVQLIRKELRATVVLDGYRFGMDFQKAVRTGQATMMLIDDHNQCGDGCANWVLDQNLGASQSRYESPSMEQTHFLLGPTFALLREEYMTLPSARDTALEPKHLLITLGGLVARDVYQRIIKAIATWEMPGLIVKVLAPELKLPAADSRIQFIGHQHHMADLLKWADLAICAGGSTNWEMCRAGLPRLIVSTAENQLLVARSLHTCGAAIDLGRQDRLTTQSIQKQLRKLAGSPSARQSMSAKNHSLVDGRGAQRVVQHLMDYELARAA